MYGLNDSDLEIICNEFRKHPNVTQAILFGSRAKGTYRPGSDVDIALKGDALATTVVDISFFLNQESILPYNFDIIDYHSIDNHDLLEHINRVGKSIYTQS